VIRSFLFSLIRKHLHKKGYGILDLNPFSLCFSLFSDHFTYSSYSVISYTCREKTMQTVSYNHRHHRTLSPSRSSPTNAMACFLPCPHRPTAPPVLTGQCRRAAPARSRSKVPQASRFHHAKCSSEQSSSITHYAPPPAPPSPRPTATHSSLAVRGGREL
jgi:hypothetical protein